jgi:beta-glucosidase/6-phospho-beta-glucosidase/beta-galactosidase
LPGEDRLFRTFFMGGFECSTHRTQSGRRLDVVASTAHDRFVSQDYARLRGVGIAVAREGLRWHLIEKRRGELDFSTAVPFLRAAREHGVQLVFDLCHYGWPDWLDVWSPEFVQAFARLAEGFARFHRRESDDPLFVTPVNEISFFSWAAGHQGIFYPYARGRGRELKEQLVRAAIAAIDAVWSVVPNARIVHTDPVINVIAHPARPQDRERAEAYRLVQYEAMEMVAGRTRPELGGHPRYVDVVGLNYYHDNQWYYGLGRKIPRDHPSYRPLSALLREWADRFERPILIAETGIEGSARPAWLRWVCDEVRRASEQGLDVQGICLYPIVNHPGWTNNRHCHNGLWDYPDEAGNRPLYAPLAKELRRQMRLFAGTEEVAAERRC